MVDFNKLQIRSGDDITVGTPANDLIKTLIIEAKTNALIAFEDSISKSGQGSYPPVHTIQSRLFSYYATIREPVRERLNEEDFQQLEEDLNSEDFNILKQTFYRLNQFVYELKITDIFTKKVYDTSDVESENTEKGL
jgi:hypothetical protein